MNYGIYQALSKEDLILEVMRVLEHNLVEGEPNRQALYQLLSTIGVAKLISYLNHVGADSCKVIIAPQQTILKEVAPQ